MMKRVEEPECSYYYNVEWDGEEYNRQEFEPIAGKYNPKYLNKCDLIPGVLYIIDELSFDNLEFCVLHEEQVYVFLGIYDNDHNEQKLHSLIENGLSPYRALEFLSL